MRIEDGESKERGRDKTTEEEKEMGSEQGRVKRGFTVSSLELRSKVLANWLGESFCDKNSVQSSATQEL